MANRTQLSERFLQAFNDRRYAPNDLRDYISDQVVITVPAAGQEFHGLAGAAQFNDGWAQAFSDAKVGDIKTVDRGAYVETQFRGRGTFNGIFQTPQGAVKGDGSRRVDVPFSQRVWVAGDKIARVELAFDPAELFGQMGLG